MVAAVRGPSTEASERRVTVPNSDRGKSSDRLRAVAAVLTALAAVVGALAAIGLFRTGSSESDEAASTATTSGITTSVILGSSSDAPATPSTSEIQTDTTRASDEPSSTTSTNPPMPLELDILELNQSDWDSRTEWRPEGTQRGELRIDWGPTMEIRWLLDPPIDGERPGVGLLLVYEEACWDPAIRGPLESVVFSVARRALEANTGATPLTSDQFGVSERFLIFQSGDHLLADPNPEFSDPEWQIIETRPLGPTDFEPEADFTDSGEEICFGIARSTSTGRGPGIEMFHSLDNFTVSAQPAEG